MEMPVPGMELSGQALRKLMQVEREYLLCGLDLMRERHGGVQGFLETELSFGPDKRAQLMALLTE